MASRSRSANRGRDHHRRRHSRSPVPRNDEHRTRRSPLRRRDFPCPPLHVPEEEHRAWAPTHTHWDDNAVYGIPLPRTVPDNEHTRRFGIAHMDPLDIRASQILNKGTNGYPFRKLAAGKFMMFQGCRSSAEWKMTNKLSMALGKLTQEHKCTVDRILQVWALKHGIGNGHSTKCDDIIDHLMNPLLDDLHEALDPKGRSRRDSPHRGRSQKKSKSPHRRANAKRSMSRRRSRTRSRSVRTPTRKQIVNTPSSSRAGIPLPMLENSPRTDRIIDAIKSQNDKFETRMSSIEKKLTEAAESDPRTLLKKYRRGGRTTTFASKNIKDFTSKGLTESIKGMNKKDKACIKQFEDDINSLVDRANNNDPPFSNTIIDHIVELLQEWGMPKQPAGRKAPSTSALITALAVANSFS